MSPCQMLQRAAPVTKPANAAGISCEPQQDILVTKKPYRETRSGPIRQCKLGVIKHDDILTLEFRALSNGVGMVTVRSKKGLGKA